MRQQSSSRFDRNDRGDRNERPERNFGSSQSSSRRNEWNSDRMSGDYSEFGNNQDRDLSGSTYGSYGNEDQYRYSGAERGDRSQRWDRTNRSDRTDRSDRSDRGDRGQSEMHHDMNQDRYMTDSDRYNQRYGSSQGSETFSSSGRDIEGGGYGSQSSRNSSWPSSERFGSSQDRYGSSQDRSESQDRYSSQSQSRGRHEGKGPKGFKRSDDRIKEEICEMLTRDPSIDASEIDIEVKEGEVTLTGSVPDRRMKHLAEDCVERSFGVRDVTNQIRVKREGSMTSSSSDLAESSSSRSSSSSSSSSNPTSGSKRASSSSSLS
jgi:Predicted periplasmic or secreted lipoprotein